MAAAETDVRIEELLQRYFQNKEIAKERNDENKEIFEQLEQLFEELNEESLTVPLPDGMEAVLSRSVNVREVLDKDALAMTLLVDKDEIRTPFDYSMFTVQGKLTPDMITAHTMKETVTKMKLQKRKPRRRSSRRRARSSDES